LTIREFRITIQYKRTAGAMRDATMLANPTERR